MLSCGVQLLLLVYPMLQHVKILYSAFLYLLMQPGYEAGCTLHDSVCMHKR